MTKKQQTKASKLHDVLVLNRYILHLFGLDDFKTLAGNLKSSDLEGCDENNVSFIHHELVRQLRPNAKLTKEQLYEYDQNIVSHTLSINAGRDKTISWRYFQYFSLLFAEIYLDKYFRNQDSLLNELNTFVAAFNDPKNNKVSNDSGRQIPLFDKNEINKLAFWNATGSGKTLLMHVNIRQYLHYQKKYRQSRSSLNKILLVTPNEGLSAQHLGEFSASNIDAGIFSRRGSFERLPEKVEVIEISKLAETSGEKTVAVEAFETDNLVLIDEGHRGIAGEQWKQRRDILSQKGFAFEYSATFGQAVNAASGYVTIKKDGQRQRIKQKDILIEEYAKSVLFDYSYKFFYHDGYGKDYRILNITDDSNEEFVRKYLTGSLLAFYQQKKIYLDNSNDATLFNIENPLWVFVGSSVNAVRTRNKKPVSDVLNIIQFFTQFIKDKTRSKADLNEILSGKSGLVNDMGVSLFRNAFTYLQIKNLSIDELYADILKLVFNTQTTGANVYLDNLAGAEGELGLRVGQTENYFGAINVGDEKKLWKLCQANNISGSEKTFGKSLFQSINNEKGNNINLLIGAKKFTEGWSSWRVSTMGLMNIGKGEGSQIIQLFGRGVRLKGYDFSLKRSSGLDIRQKPSKAIPEYLSTLETLYIFGIRANYMQRFKEYLESEGLPANDGNFETYNIPIHFPTVHLEEHQLKIIRIKEGLDFASNEQLALQYEKFWKGSQVPVTINWYPKVQTVFSDGKLANEPESEPYATPLHNRHLYFINWQSLFFDIQQFCRERNWVNLSIDIKNLKILLQKKGWYNLYVPKSSLNKPVSFHQKEVWQDIALSLLKSYTERYYNYKKAEYESKNLETYTLTKEHENFFKEYQIFIDEGQKEIIHKLTKLKSLFEKFGQNHFVEIDEGFSAISFTQHLYQPLLYLNAGQYKNLIKIKPTALNKGEIQFVEDLKYYYENNKDFYEDKQLFLLRNLSRKGVGFFDAHNFYPDFILWLLVGKHQHIAFIDPKGLRNVQGINSPKIQFYKTVKTTIEKRLNDPDVSLSSFIVTPTKYHDVKGWFEEGKGLLEFNQRNVYFQWDQSHDYIGKILQEVCKDK